MKLKESIGKSINEYLDSTTIHGFSYLSSGRNILEKLAWMTIICVCFTFAALLIQQSIEEARLNPVMTNVETVPIQQVPFPAITVDSGMPNPLRHSQRIFNGLAFDTIPFEDLLEADELRMKVSSVLDDMILKINISLLYSKNFWLSWVELFIFKLKSSRLINPGKADDDHSNAIRLKKRLEYAIKSPSDSVLRDVDLIQRLEDWIGELASDENRDTM